jgi:hypothetical protein
MLLPANAFSQLVEQHLKSAHHLQAAASHGHDGFVVGDLSFFAH